MGKRRELFMLWSPSRRRAYLRAQGAPDASAPEDAGSVLAMVVIIAAVLAITVSSALFAASLNTSESQGYGNRTAARLAAESGIQAALADMRNATSVASLPCTLNDTLPATSARAASYRVSVNYGSSVSCAGSTPIGSAALGNATVSAWGTDGTATVEMQATVQVAQAPAAYDYGLYTPGQVDLNNAEVGDNVTPDDVFAEQGVSCTAGGILGWLFAFAGWQQGGCDSNPWQWSAQGQPWQWDQPSAGEANFPVIWYANGPQWDSSWHVTQVSGGSAWDPTCTVTASQLATDLDDGGSAETQPTVLYAPGCTVDVSGTHVLTHDTVIVAGAVSTAASEPATNFEDPSGAAVNLAIIVPWNGVISPFSSCSTRRGMLFANAASFGPMTTAANGSTSDPISTFLYAPGQIVFDSTVQIDGQVLGGAFCGGANENGIVVDQNAGASLTAQVVFHNDPTPGEAVPAVLTDDVYEDQSGGGCHICYSSRCCCCLYGGGGGGGGCGGGGDNPPPTSSSTTTTSTTTTTTSPPRSSTTTSTTTTSTTTTSTTTTIVSGGGQTGSGLTTLVTVQSEVLVSD